LKDNIRLSHPIIANFTNDQNYHIMETGLDEDFDADVNGNAVGEDVDAVMDDNNDDVDAVTDDVDLDDIFAEEFGNDYDDESELAPRLIES